MCDSEVILLGEIRCLSPSGIKGLSKHLLSESSSNVVEKFSSGGQNGDIINKELFEEIINTFFSKCGILSRFSVIGQKSTAG